MSSVNRIMDPLRQSLWKQFYRSGGVATLATVKSDGLVRLKSTVPAPSPSYFAKLARKKKLDPEKARRAQEIVNLYRANNYMFGELLESKQEKIKRVKAEKRQMRRPNSITSTKRDDDYYLNPMISSELGGTETGEPLPASANVITSPRSLPKAEKSRISKRLRNQEEKARGYISFPQLQEMTTGYSKGAEINWVLKTTPKMTKVLKGASFNNEASTSTLRHNNAEHGQDDDDGGIHGKGTVQGMNTIRNNGLENGDEGSNNEASSHPLKKEQEEKRLQNNAHIFQDILGIEDFKPRSKLTVLKFGTKKTENSGPTTRTKKTTTHDRNKSEPLKISPDIPIPSISPEKFHSILSKKMFEDEAIDEDEDRTKSLVQNDGGSGNPSTTITNAQESLNSKAATCLEKEHKEEETSIPRNARNQTTPSIIISVPYFNPEREGAAPEKSDQNLDQTLGNTTDDFSHNNRPVNEIISISYPRYSSSNQAGLGSSPAPYFPSVSKILSATMPQEQAEALARWQAKMISELGEEGFRQYKENLFNNGKMMHSNIEEFLRGTPLNEIVVADSISGHWNSLQNILPIVQNVCALESHVFHPKLMYGGIVDCVATFRNKLVVIDWKTSQKQKPLVSMTYDTPLQIAAYIGAINYDPNYSFKIEEGLIVIAYEDGRKGHTFLLKQKDIEKYWEKWLNRLNLYKENISKSQK